MTTHSHRLLRNLNFWNIRKSFSKFFFSPLGLFTLPVSLCARSGGTCWLCFDCAKCLKTPLDVIGDDWTVYFFRLNLVGPKSGYESLVTGRQPSNHQLCARSSRVLFGRLRSKAGSKFQGKASAATRSSIILRFLAGCQAEELGIFINLLLEPVHHHSEGRELI